ncbi:MAG: glutamate 5-kinase, partial [Lachnospiraceae bacterium]|nr:glutamate 5-kinase [Lachnospiraceae bacterium]
IGTLFDGHREKDLSAKKHWILYRSIIKGQIVVDDGAFNAIKEKHTSLLPKGIVDVKGDFMISSVVDIVNSEGEICGKGMVNYSSDEIKLIKGLPTGKIKDVLHYKDYDEVIHADNLVVIKE